MSDNNNSDIDYIQDKVDSTNKSNTTDNIPNYRGFIMTIIQSMIQIIILF